MPLQVLPEDETLVNRFFRYYYGPFITKISVQTAALLIYASYLAVAIYGALNLQLGLDPRKLVPSNYTFARYIDKIESDFFAKGAGAQIQVYLFVLHSKNVLILRSLSPTRRISLIHFGRRE